MTRLSLKIANKALCNFNVFYVKSVWGKDFFINVKRTNTFKLKLTDEKGKSYDKCTMSNWFISYDYYNIYWNTANKEQMIDTIINEIRNELFK